MHYRTYVRRNECIFIKLLLYFFLQIHNLDNLAGAQESNKTASHQLQ